MKLSIIADIVSQIAEYVEALVVGDQEPKKVGIEFQGKLKTGEAELNPEPLGIEPFSSSKKKPGIGMDFDLEVL